MVELCELPDGSTFARRCLRRCPRSSRMTVDSKTHGKIVDLVTRDIRTISRLPETQILGKTGSGGQAVKNRAFEGCRSGLQQMRSRYGI
jgi:hypothetical protein